MTSIKQPFISSQATSSLPKRLIPHLIYGPPHFTISSIPELPSDEHSDESYQCDQFGLLLKMSEATSCKVTETQQQPLTKLVEVKNDARMTRHHPKRKMACNYG